MLRDGRRMEQMSERFTVSLEAELARQFDEYMQRKGAQNRSEAVRDLIREALAREQLDRDPDVNCLGVLTYLYNHHERELSKRLTEAHHAHHDLTVTTLHMHLDHDHCLEAVLLKGPGSQIESFGDAVMARPGIRHGRLHKIPAPSGSDEHGHIHSHGHWRPHDHDDDHGHD
jgi:CopG family transcriptional regulator, nickel-responsive regulator